MAEMLFIVQTLCLGHLVRWYDKQHLRLMLGSFNALQCAGVPFRKINRGLLCATEIERPFFVT